jgi:biopolymer transport protein ExbB
MFNNLTFWEAVKVGGPVMLVLIFCSILSLGVIIERLFHYFKRSRISRAKFMESIRELIKKGDIDQALNICKKTHAPFAKVVATALEQRHQDEKDITEALEREVVIEANDLERRIVIVGTIGSTAVYIGLLGTVWGIIKTFNDIAKHGSGGLNVVIAGISEALICTAAGLFVAIPAVMAYNFFLKRINKFVTDMELCASEMGSLIRGQKK